MRDYSRDYDWFGVWFALAIVALIALLVWLFIAEKRAQDACAAAGGRYEVVGHHLQSSVLIVGKMIIPQVHDVADYGCVGARPEKAP